MAPLLTISIVNWNTRQHLAHCLDALRSACEGVHAEIIVVDNSSSDGSVELVRERFPEVRLFALDENVGFAAANNLAIAESRGEFLLLLNPDVYAPENSIRNLLAFLVDHPDASGVGAALEGADGRVQTPFYRRFPSRAQILLFYTGLSYLTWWVPLLKHRYFDFQISGSRPIHVDQLPGACCLVRRSVIDDVGMLDPDYFIWFEDVDWCFAMAQAGHQLLVLPTTRMLHAGGASFKAWSSDRRVWQFYLALFRFLCKHQQDDLLRWARPVLLTDMWIKEWVIRFIPFSDRLPIPQPATFRALRQAIRSVLDRYRAGEPVRLTDQDPAPISSAALAAS